MAQNPVQDRAQEVFSLLTRRKENITIIIRYIISN